ncbi:MAG TPA: hypothetical protein PK122_01615 [Candidatus Paceibacterota bacterium]|jgi:hypothetical protein|nr:hypothetical protein [Candidatus Paceibacterota bacterium]
MDNEKRAAQFANGMQSNIKITPEIIKNSKTITCECGGVLFKEELFFKVLSPLISPSGQEQLLPMPVFVCTKCGKVPSVFDSQNVLPDEVKAKAPFIGSQITDEMVEDYSPKKKNGN